MAQVSPHDWLLPRLTELVKNAEAAGIDRGVSVAVITDLINGPSFSGDELAFDEKWNQDIDEPAYMVNADKSVSDESLADAEVEALVPPPFDPVGPCV